MKRGRWIASWPTHKPSQLTAVCVILLFLILSLDLCSQTSAIYLQDNDSTLAQFAEHPTQL